MKNQISKIYISGALVLATTEQKNIYKKIAKICESVCNNIYVPHLNGTDPKKIQIFRRLLFGKRIIAK